MPMVIELATCYKLTTGTKRPKARLDTKTTRCDASTDVRPGDHELVGHGQMMQVERADGSFA